MKCNELMVGDWIADALGIPMQVISVGYTYAYAERNDENDYDWEEFEDKECKPCPILLTDEFFKRNNFDEDILYWTERNGIFALPTLLSAMELQDQKNDIDELAETIDGADLLRNYTACVWSCSRCSKDSGWIMCGGGFTINYDLCG